MADQPRFTVCCLFYGDYPVLANRLLHSLDRADWHRKRVFELRIGLNSVSANVFAMVGKHVARWRHYGTTVVEYTGEAPYWKYPLMRRMFREPQITTEHVMWFDDDSWIKPAAPGNWFDLVATSMKTRDMMGSIWYHPLVGNQAEFIRAQPWYTGREIGNRVTFVTGGWWTIRTELVYRYDWPPSFFHHNGGDMMLGALFHQQGLRFGRFEQHVAINADQSGKCSTAKRRGARLRVIGADYKKENE